MVLLGTGYRNVASFLSAEPNCPMTPWLSLVSARLTPSTGKAPGGADARIFDCQAGGHESFLRSGLNEKDVNRGNWPVAEPEIGTIHAELGQ